MKKDHYQISDDHFLPAGLICHIYQNEEEISSVVEQIAPICWEKNFKLAASKNGKITEAFDPTRVVFVDQPRLDSSFKLWLNRQQKQALTENFQGICLLLNLSGFTPDATPTLYHFFQELKDLTSSGKIQIVCHIHQHQLTSSDQFHLILNSQQIIVGTKLYSTPLRSEANSQDETLFEKLFSLDSQNDEKKAFPFFRNKDLQDLTEHPPVLMADIDYQQQVLLANFPFCNFFNSDCHSITGTPLRDILGVNNFLKLQQELSRVLKGDEISFTKQITDQKQEPHELAFTLIPRHKEANTQQSQLHFYTLIAQDITKRKEIEKQNLLQSKALETAANGILITDRLGNILWANPAISSMTNYSINEILQKNPKIFKSGKQNPNFYRDMWDTISSGKVWHGEVTNRRKDGSFYIEEMTITPVSIEGDNTISHFIAIKQDITNRKLAEKALKESEERYRTMIESQGEGAAIFNAQLEFEYLNQAAETIIGYTLAEVLGTSLFRMIPENYRKIIQEQFIQRQSGKLNSYELSVTRKDRQEITLLVTATPRYNQAGEFIGSFTVFRDITKRKQVENKLRFQSAHDGLTGLFNRLHFEEKMRQLKTENEFPLSIIVIDVDNLKVLNDSNGHLAGDELLKKVGGMLHKSFRGEDIIARIGGDEFAILLPRTDWQSVQELIFRLETNISEVNQAIHDFPVSISIGSATVENDREVINLFKIADERMYAHKRMKKSQRDSGI